MTEASEPNQTADSGDAPAERRGASWWQRLLPWAITIACFGWLYRKISVAAGPDQNAIEYLGEIFASVSWGSWLALMIPYSVFFLLVDTAVLWRVINWFNARISYSDLLPVRASTYIISILNEQVGKGAMAVYLNRREGVPGWQVGSSMLFIMFCEFYYLLFWALVGWVIARSVLPDELDAIRWIALGAVVFFAGFVWFFRSSRFEGNQLRERQILTAFRQAKPWNYLVVMLLRSPALLAAVWVYSQAAALFGVDIPLRDMMGFLPVIFFGTLVPGPFRAVAISLWTVLFPDKPAEMAAFGFVQHNFFVLFNAGIGLLFLRRANRELFGGGS